MKKPDRLIGYIKYDNIDFPFHFDEESFTITLYPPTIEKWRETASPLEFFRNFNNNFKNAGKKHEWIKDINLQGITADGNNVIFNVMDNRNNYNGIYSYGVNWYFYYQNDALPDSIIGFKVLSPEVNSFFPPNIALNSSISFDEHTNRIKEISVVSNGFIAEPCGKYRISPHIDASMSVSAYTIADIRNAKNPISAISAMETSFSSPVDFKVLIKACSILNGFLKFVTYRKNITFERIEVAFINEQGKEEYSGILCFKKNLDSEIDKKAQKCIINFYVLNQKISKLFISIKNNKFSFQHLCNSLQKTHSYSSSRIIMILAAFEREYRNIYGTDFGRSPEYIAVKEEVVKLINNYAETKHGKSKKYAKTLSNFVNNRDSSFGENLKRALIDHEEIMKPFVGKKYNGKYEEIAEEIGSRMGEVRNGIAHDKLDWHFDAVHLCDIKIVEELLYAMILKDLHLDTKKIQKGINDLFDENFAIAI